MSMRKKSIISLIISLVLCIGMCMQVSASEKIYTLSPTPPIISEVETRGENPPSGSADTHDLSVSAYNYQVKDVGYQVFTSKGLMSTSKYYIGFEVPTNHNRYSFNGSIYEQ